MHWFNVFVLPLGHIITTWPCITLSLTWLCCHSEQAIRFFPKGQIWGSGGQADGALTHTLMSALKYEVESWSDIPLPLRIHTPLISISRYENTTALFLSPGQGTAGTQSPCGIWRLKNGGYTNFVPMKTQASAFSWPPCSSLGKVKKTGGTLNRTKLPLSTSE